MKRLLFIAAIALAGVAFGEGAAAPAGASAPKQKRSIKDMTPAERKEFKEKMRERMGDLLKIPDAYPGACFLDCSEKTPAGVADKVATKVVREFFISSYVRRGAFKGLADLGKFAAQTNHACVVAIAEAGEGLPWLLTAPDAKWALVNLTPLMADRPTAEKLAHRVEYVAQRGFGILMGAAWTAQGISVMMPAKDLSELDSIRGEVMPPDCHFPVLNYCQLRGVAKGGFAPYRIACKEGWAPAPTNAQQKAIWDDVKAKGAKK